jgi:hypothetical protein
VFLHSYSEAYASGSAAGLAPLWLIPALKLYLTDFLKRTFPGENALNHAFCGGKKLKAAAVYQASFNHGGGLWPGNRNLTHYARPFRAKRVASGCDGFLAIPCTSGRLQDLIAALFTKNPILTTRLSPLPDAC